MGICPRLEFDITRIYYLVHDFFIFGEFDFLWIPLPIYDFIYDTTITHEGILI